MTIARNIPDPKPATPFEYFSASISDVAISLLGKKPLWMILNFVYSSYNNAVVLFDDENEGVKTIRKHCSESLLLLTLVADTETEWCTSLFDELCNLGFTSDLKAVLCADHYCAWLRSRGRSTIIEETISRVETHISHSFFKKKLRSIEAKFNCSKQVQSKEKGLRSPKK
jgi:hypothetical protein